MIVCFIVLVVLAFRKRIAWGFIVLFVPFGGLVFAVKHWSEVGKVFVLMIICTGACWALTFTSPLLIAAQIKNNSRFVSLVKSVNPDGYKEAQKLLDAQNPAASGQASAKPTPHEVRDLAENEAPVNATPTPDPNAVMRAAYLKHAKELTAAYQGLEAERAKLKSGSPAVAAFNTKAARYQHDLQTLAEEKTRLDALDHARNANVDAAAALATLRTAADTGDYETFAATLKKSLSDYRQTPAFPQIVALARPVLQQATPDRVLTGLQGKAASAARGEFDKTTKKVQGIVNQVPTIVSKPPAGAEVYHYAFHPGAEPPNYDAENLASTRELWKGEYAYIEGVPDVYYRSADCEFNPQTKFFYTSRAVPKKKLTDAEYAELTRLYHQLGQQQKAIASISPPSTADAERVSADLATLKAQLDGYAMK